jgi:hypothetical protein
MLPPLLLLLPLVGLIHCPVLQAQVLSSRMLQQQPQA